MTEQIEQFIQKLERINQLYLEKCDTESLPNLFTIKQSCANYHIYGNGLGHNVGLCQYGAVELARRGRNWRQILDFYYSPKLPPIHNN